jgi:hypothetical protein
MDQQKKGLLDPSDSVICLLDHQAGLLQAVKDISLAELRVSRTCCGYVPHSSISVHTASECIHVMRLPAASRVTVSVWCELGAKLSISTRKSGPHWSW